MKKMIKSNEKCMWREERTPPPSFVIEFDCDIHYVLTLTITITDQHTTARHCKNALHYASNISSILRVCRQKITHGKSFIWILNWDNKWIIRLFNWYSKRWVTALCRSVIDIPIHTYTIDVFFSSFLMSLVVVACTSICLEPIKIQPFMPSIDQLIDYFYFVLLLSICVLHS